jgi:DNA-binding phage protein
MTRRNTTPREQPQLVDLAAPSPQPEPPAADSPFRDPDFVDRVWAYMLQSWPQRLADIAPTEVEDVKQYIRQSERGERPYITPAGDAARERKAQQILSCFNGRNATEVARMVGCSRATVYRVLKQAGRVASAPAAEQPQ